MVGKSIEAEYLSTARYAAGGIELGWSATVGNDVIALHMPFNAWGWNAREASSLYLALELAQANLGDPVGDGQIRAAVWFYQQAHKTWPQLPASFPNHSDLPAGIRDGKSDIEPRGQHTVRDRVLAELKRVS